MTSELTSLRAQVSARKAYHEKNEKVDRASGYLSSATECMGKAYEDDWFIEQIDKATTAAAEEDAQIVTSLKAALDDYRIARRTTFADAPSRLAERIERIIEASSKKEAPAAGGDR